MRKNQSRHQPPRSTTPRANTTARLLLDGFDPATLPPGLYATRSGTEAYQFARLSVDAGELNLVGERDEADGSITLVVMRPGRVNPNDADDTAFAGAITLGAEYFQAPLREYKEWPVKWWREVVQNAVDAGATTLTLGTTQHPDGTVTVYSDDNAGGMSREVLFDKFLIMGGTTKTGEGTTGGFGKAKELILLPWLAWTVTSGDYVVRAPTGGVAWEATRAQSARRGTRVEVVQPPGNHTTITAALEFLQRSWLPNIRITLVVNGEALKWTPAKEANVFSEEPLRDLPGMAIYFLPSETREAERNWVWVRINGLFMFQRYVESTPGQLVVELKGNSLATLTSNRDGFATNILGWELDGFLSELSKDSTSALEKKLGWVEERYVTGKRTYATLPPLDVPVGTPTARAGRTSTRVLTADDITKVVTQFEQGIADVEEDGKGSFEDAALAEIGSRAAIRQAAAQLLANLVSTSDRQLEAALAQLVWQPDFILINKVSHFKIPAKFKPATMTPGVVRLAKMWTEICRWVLMQLGCGAPYAVGFIFSPTTTAAYLSKGGEHWLLLNPFALDRRMTTTLKAIHAKTQPSATAETLDIVRVTERADFRHVYALAVHECTHFANEIDYHDEAFASAMTANFSLCADGMSQWRTLLDATAARRTPGGPAARPRGR